MFGPHDQGNCILVSVNSGLWPVRGLLISFVAIYYSILLLFREGTFQLMSLFKTDATRTQSVAVPNMVGQLWWLLDCDWSIVELTDNFNPARSLAHYSPPRVSCTSETTCRVVVEKQRKEPRQCPGQPKLGFSFQ